MLDARITSLPLDPRAEYDHFIRGLSGEGAVVTFAGIARARTSDGVIVDQLFLDHHPSLSEQSVRAIAGAALDRFDVSTVTAVHRYGAVRPGETIVFVAAASAHRRAAFAAADYMMDRLKTEAVFWKREDTHRGAHWVEPTDADHDSRMRWSN